ncbi:MAG: hypothetical protein GQ529_08640 [Methyloprofundus sp.]|nr:hypothetical protein [Methyloprofundus sp.]
MQINLPDIKQLLTDWYLLTLENPLYAGALVLSVWLLTVFFYTFRIYFLNKRQRVIEQAGVKVQGLLDEAQQQTKEGEEKLIAVTEQLEKEQRLATEFSVKADQRNQQIVENIKQLASQFNLSEQLVTSDKKPEPDFVWQQQDNIQMQLTERLQAESHEKKALQETYKQEKEQFSKQKTVIEHLQKTLDLQTGKSIQLEQDLNTQSGLLQQQKNEAEQELVDKLAALQAKHQSNVALLVNELSQQKEALDIAIKDKQIVATEIKAAVAPVIMGEQQELGAIDSSIGVPEQGIKNLFSKTTKPIDKSELELQVEEVVVEIPVPKVEELEEFEIAEPEAESEIEKIVEVVAPKASILESEEIDLEPNYTASNLGIAGKFKGLFGGKDKKSFDKSELERAVEVVAPKISVPDREEVDLEADYAVSNLDISGKFRGLFGGKDKKSFDKSELEKAVEVVAPKISVPEPEEVDLETGYTVSNLDISGKFKGLFGKKNKTPAVKPEPEQQAKVLAAEAPMLQTEEVIAEVRTPDPEEQEDAGPDYTESNLHLPSKLKKLFGKS